MFFQNMYPTQFFLLGSPGRDKYYKVSIYIILSYFFLFKNIYFVGSFTVKIDFYFNLFIYLFVFFFKTPENAGRCWEMKFIIVEFRIVMHFLLVHYKILLKIEVFYICKKLLFFPYLLSLKSLSTH